MKYSLNKLSGKLGDYAFDFGGVIALRNFTVRTNGNRLIVESAKDANFAILDALVNEVEIDGVVYDTVESAQLALQKLVFNPDTPVILSESKLEELNTALVKYSESLKRINAVIAKGDKAVQDANKDVGKAVKYANKAVANATRKVADAISKVASSIGKVVDDAVAKAVNSAVGARVPVGLISMWNGQIDDIPEGWHLCDGANGTPDLRNRFVVGAGYSYKVHDVGGENAHTLSVKEMPSHTHTGSTTEDGRHNHRRDLRNKGGDVGTKDTNRWQSGGAASGGYVWKNDGSYSTAYGGNHTHNLNIKNMGGGVAHENRPPYYALAYIMYGG